jgi:2-oxoglutarate dehydrogenase E2 component (dihydrolipoamide succinyltransferase)
VATGTAVDVVMPQMGVSVSEGTVTKWLKSVGDTVAADEPLLEISTDKVDTEVPSPGSGVVSEIVVQEGETVEVGTVLARIGGDAGAAATAGAEAPAVTEPAPEPAPAEEEPEVPPEPATQAAADAAMASADGGLREAPEREEPLSPPTEPAAAPSHDGNGARSEHHFVSPVVARIAAEHGVDPASVAGTGRGGRVTKRDMMAFLETRGEQPEPAQAPAPEAPPSPPQVAAQPEPAQPGPAQPAPAQPAPAAQRPPEPPAAPSAQPQAAAPGESVEPMNAMRRGIAEHMRRSLDTAAHVTSAIEVDMSKVVAIRERLKPEFERAYGVNPTYLSFVARATVDTLRDWPWVNAELRGESIVTRGHVNLGFAVALEGGKGLIVPVLKNAEGLNLLGMARGLADLAERARTKKLTPDDVQGGTFTITNPGGFGTFHGTPIISQPQSAILGTYALVKRPWVVTDDAGNDAVAIRPMMNVTLTYDHRLVDGAYGAQFLAELRERLQTWDEGAY